MATGTASGTEEKGALREVAWVAFKLGCTAFGGPAAHIAMLREEIVARRKWTTEQHFVDLIGVTNLLPGPNSTEMVIHAGYERAGWRGLVVAGVLFILPAAAITLLFAWLYVRYGTTPTGEWLLYGIKPVIIAVVAQALWNLGRTAVKGPLLAGIGVAVFALYLTGVNELLLLFGGGLLVALVAYVKRSRGDGRWLGVVAAPVGVVKLPIALAVAAGAAEPYSAARLLLTFLKIGATLYGSGYVLLAFLRNDFVVRYGWITEQQLLDAVAVGQFTPGPVFTTATFVGYLVGGWSGAALATIGIFVPAFAVVGVVNPFLPRLRRSAWTASLLDGINVAAIGLMGAVTWELGRAAVVDWETAVLAVAAGLALVRCKINSAWLVLVGGVIGLLMGWLVG